MGIGVTYDAVAKMAEARRLDGPIGEARPEVWRYAAAALSRSAAHRRTLIAVPLPPIHAQLSGANGGQAPKWSGRCWLTMSAAPGETNRAPP